MHELFRKGSRRVIHHEIGREIVFGWDYEIYAGNKTYIRFSKDEFMNLRKKLALIIQIWRTKLCDVIIIKCWIRLDNNHYLRDNFFLSDCWSLFYLLISKIDTNENFSKYCSWIFAFSYFWKNYYPFSFYNTYKHAKWKFYKK